MTALDVVARPIARATRLPLLAPLAGRDFRLVLGRREHLAARRRVPDRRRLVARPGDLTGSGLALGTILIAAAIPRGIFMLLGGVLADRISPRDLALGSNVLRAVADDDRRHPRARQPRSRSGTWPSVGVVFGTVDAVFLPAINTLVPRLVPPSRLAAANALMQGTAQLMGTVGPAIAGFAIALIGVGIAFVIDAASFAIAALALWLVRSGRDRRPRHGTGRRTRPSATATATPAPDPDPTTTAEPPPASIASALIEGARDRARRPGHALDRHRLDRRQPRLHRSDRGRPAVARPGRLRRRRPRARAAVRGLRCRFAGRRPCSVARCGGRAASDRWCSGS